MLGVRVIGLVHADRRRVVVDGQGHLAAEAHFQAGAGAAPAGEQVDDDRVVGVVQGQAVLGFEVERGGLLEGSHAGSLVSWK
ncbi:hypothetical protein vBPaePE220_00066 [Pseudomonas phage vB_PaeP_E220]|uniref:Uncharacterized protein n=1 Tax=Pseudomonas phage vB_PaeP_E220 TaxID=2034343 RepID=A0A2K8HNY4_9CAUD|nr:hypothetical protein QGM56_gp66 [Pseudomonas phage vB_PaeP_E220]ASZ72206.1 hypothetical protein vBPaePE220_00066 [Pseudomonas phage vB_PaeP_E220]